MFQKTYTYDTCTVNSIHEFVEIQHDYKNSPRKLPIITAIRQRM